MPWQDNSGGGDRSPWGQGPRGGGGGGGQQPPNLDEILKKGQNQFKSFVPNRFGGGKGLGLIVLILVGLWLATGFFRVQPNQQGVALVFGDWNGTPLGEGLHWQNQWHAFRITWLPQRAYLCPLLLLCLFPSLLRCLSSVACLRSPPLTSAQGSAIAVRLLRPHFPSEDG